MTAAHNLRSASAEAFLRRLQADEGLRGRIAFADAQPGSASEHASLPEGLPPPLGAALRASGRPSLYRHQREAIDLALAGKNVVIATETSSGKSLCFQLPVLAAVMNDPKARALFIFPTNPLANDQEESLKVLLEQVPSSVRPRPPVRLQGSMGAEKSRLAASDPQIVLTNPEMVHLHLLPQSQRWESLWRGLRYIVVDEIHLYRGAFGGHLANLLRRVRRCAWRYGAKPQVIAASATVGNPKALAEELCSTQFELVDRSAAPRGPRTTVLWQPPAREDGTLESHIDESIDLFRNALSSGLQTILFTRSRQQVELMVSRLEERAGKSRIQLGVRAYRAGYLREEREVIERGLRDGSVRGVVTTNALEVGIDIGSLDVCIIAGYPGSVMALRQQAGRVGRRDRSSAIFLVASANPIDTWLLKHPEKLVNAAPERAVIGRLNPNILRSHLLCAASEFPLWEAEIERFGGERARSVVAESIERGEARWEQERARTVLVAQARPHRNVSLRSATQQRFSLVDPDGEVIGEVDGSAAIREAHPGAIYLHQGRSFRVERHEDDAIFLVPARPGLSTRIQGDRLVVLGPPLKSRELEGGWAEVELAPVDVVDRYSGYLEFSGGGRPRSNPITPPIESQLKTEGLVLRLTPKGAMAIREMPVASALHGAEHLLGAFCASRVLCDRDDMEGHTLTDPLGPAIVLFDRYPGGMGFAAAAFDSIDEIVDRSGEAVEGCQCDDGCPACVHTGRCLRTSDDVSKLGAKQLLRLIRGLPMLSGSEPRRRTTVQVQQSPVRQPRKSRQPSPELVQQANGGPVFRVGELVEHPSFGTGRVLEVRKSGRVVVQFKHGQPRRITPGWLKKAH